MNIIGKNMTEIIDSYTTQRNIHLLVAYYNDKNLDRQGEIDLALRLNIKNKIFEKIIIVNETTNLTLPDPRVIIVPTDKRPTFRNFFDLANFYTSDDTVNILINSDIILGEGLEKITELENDHQAICLSRYDILEDGTYSPDFTSQEDQRRGSGSHDCWIWKGRMRGENSGKFYMGQWHCDGVLAGELYDNGYTLKNPIYDLRSYHLHLTNIRNYNPFDVKVKGLRRGVFFSKNDGVFTKDDTYYEGYTS